MVQKFRENVEIGNKVNFRDKIFIITEKFCDFKTACNFTPPTLEDFMFITKFRISCSRESTKHQEH